MMLHDGLVLLAPDTGMQLVTTAAVNKALHNSTTTQHQQLLVSSSLYALHTCIATVCLGWSWVGFSLSDRCSTQVVADCDDSRDCGVPLRLRRLPGMHAPYLLPACSCIALQCALRPYHMDSTP
jgi:hypothetical protein